MVIKLQKTNKKIYGDSDSTKKLHIFIVQGISAKILQNLKQIGIKLNLVWLEA